VQVIKRAELEEIIRSACIEADLRVIVATRIQTAVADSDKVAALGMWNTQHQCGCPAVQAGLYEVHDSEEVHYSVTCVARFGDWSGVQVFFDSFDNKVAERFGLYVVGRGQAHVLKVVE
jgi:hypothetical protein